MKSVKQPEGPFSIELVPGITVTARPMSTLDMATAHAAASQRLERLQSSATECVEAGLLPDDRMVDLSDPAQRGGLFHQFVVVELAQRHITGWEGVRTADDTPTPVTPSTIAALMAIWPLGENFYQAFAKRHLELLAAKKDSGPAATGTSAAAPNTATDAGRKASPALRANPGSMVIAARTSQTRWKLWKKRRPGKSSAPASAS